VLTRLMLDVSMLADGFRLDQTASALT
jgi:hypothetical protein